MKSKYILFGILLLAIFLSGCMGNLVKEENKEPVKIGATWALTGTYAYFGTAELKGFQMAADEINARGGINGAPLKIIIEDNKGDAKEAVLSVQKFLNVDDVDIVISEFTHITSAIKDVVVEKKILFYVSTVKKFAEESDYAFRDYYDVEDQGKSLVDALEKFNKTKISYIGENSELCTLFKKAVEDDLKNKGIRIVSFEIFESSSNDLRTNLMKLNLKESDAIVACVWRHETIFMKQLKELGFIGKQTFQPDAPYMPVAQTQEMTDLFSENHAISAWYGYETDDAHAQEFMAKFKAKYGEEPIADSAYAYDDMMVIADALRTCDNLNRIKDRDCIKDELLKTDYVGAGGRLVFDSKGVSKRDVLFIEAVNGKWNELKI